MAHIASYLLQQEIDDVPGRLDRYFKEIYEPLKFEPGREWPPRVPRRVGFDTSAFPSFSNILVHINGADLARSKEEQDEGLLTFNPEDENLRFTVIDGQHRVNGGFLALKIIQEKEPQAQWQIPAEVFLDLDPPEGPPKTQAQIFIDVNFYQKKVDRSLVADLFPTTRAGRDPINVRERAQDIGRRLMLDTGPLVGMIQIPGVKYGVKDVVTLATLDSSIEDVLPFLDDVGIVDINTQTDFLSQVLTAWLDASGRRSEATEALDPQNVVYQGRVLVSIIALSPAAAVELAKRKTPFVSPEGERILRAWFANVIKRAGFMKGGRFISRQEFKLSGFLGSGGIARFRDRLWAATIGFSARLEAPQVAEKASSARATLYKALASLTTTKNI